MICGVFSEVLAVAAASANSRDENEVRRGDAPRMRGRFRTLASKCKRILDSTVPGRTSFVDSAAGLGNIRSLRQRVVS